jgi:hypothetical protein
MAKTMAQKERRKFQLASAYEGVKTDETGSRSRCYEVPEGMPSFWFKKTGHKKLNFMGFVVGKGNPKAKPGQLYYERTFGSHRGAGPNGEDLICLRETFNEKCPVCDEKARLRSEPGFDEDRDQALKAKVRKISIVEDADEPDKGWQIFEYAHFKSFGAMLNAALKEAQSDPEGENCDHFFAPVGGKTVKVFVEEDSFNGKTFFKAASIKFVPRKDYDESVVDEIPCLDDLLLHPTYEELEALFKGDVAEEESPARNGKPKAAKKAKPADDEEEEPEEEEDDEEVDADGDEENEEADPTAADLGIEVGSTVRYKKKEYTVKKVQAEGTVLLLANDDGDTVKGVAPSACTLVETEEEEDEEEEAPPPKKKGKVVPAKAGKGKGKQADEEEEEEDEEAEEDDDTASGFDDDTPGWDDDEGEVAEVADDEEEEDEEDEEDEPAPKKKKTVKKK